MNDSPRFSATKRRLKPGTLVLIGLLHLLAFYGLVRAFAPDFTAGVERSVVSAFTVTVTAPEEPEAPEPEPDEGAAGDPGKEAVPQPVTAPYPEGSREARSARTARLVHWRCGDIRRQGGG